MYISATPLTTAIAFAPAEPISINSPSIFFATREASIGGRDLLTTIRTFSDPVDELGSEKVRIVVSRSRPPIEASRVAKKIDGELIEMGSAGAKAMAVVRGVAEIYIHSGGQYEWDNCAPAAVALAAGLHVSRLDGSLLNYNNSDPWLPDLLICNPILALPVLEILNS
jgi:3'-phosphoadenosine 5'-phosphosulfate (PAPS) 3'-phosphatase